MKFVIPGGCGQLGQMLERALVARGHQVVLLSRTPSGDGRVLAWDGRTLGPWADAIDGSDVVINLAGRSVNCRYTKHNLTDMLLSRVDSTRVLGQAIGAAARPPRVWLQSSTATIYAHRFDAANDEATGILGGDEPGVPRYWAFSVRIATEWEHELDLAVTPQTRKVAMRTAMVMGPERGGTLDVLLGLVRFGLGGAVAGGRQYMSWMHERDFVEAIEFLVAREDLDGAINLAAPDPLPQRAFMATLREAAGAVVGLPATAWMAELGALAMRSDSELLLKSRRVVPGRLLDAGFRFAFPTWAEAARDLIAQVRARPG